MAPPASSFFRDRGRARGVGTYTPSAADKAPHPDSKGRSWGFKHPAFLLAQLGALAAPQFAERLGVLELTPAGAGILRLLRVEAGPSQQELATRMQIHPSRLVAILDNLEKGGLVERRAHTHDRRLYSIQLTKNGDEILEKIGKVAREHQDALLSALGKEERDALATLLLKISDQQGLVRGVHPGYQQLGSSKQIEGRPAAQTRRR